MKEDSNVEGKQSNQDTIYLCNFRVSVDGDWLCLRQLDDVEVPLNNRHSLHSPEYINTALYGTDMQLVVFCGKLIFDL